MITTTKDRDEAACPTHQPNPVLPRRPRFFLTDGGLETSLVFDAGLDLPEFATFPLLDTLEGRETLRRYYQQFLDIAVDADCGFVFETPTWRASSDWGEKLGYDTIDLRRVNKASVELVKQVAASNLFGGASLRISGCVGPRGDGYRIDQRLDTDAAQAYHFEQIAALADAGVDYVTATTMTTSKEAIGIARAAASLAIPCVISFTVETDGTLPSGQGLGEAISQVDAETDGAPAWFMINCAHPSHFAEQLDVWQLWTSRIGGLRANASCKSHAELDQATELDAGDPHDLAKQYAEICGRLPNIRVLGGCCGTDHRHVEAIANQIIRNG